MDCLADRSIPRLSGIFNRGIALLPVRNEPDGVHEGAGEGTLELPA